MKKFHISISKNRTPRLYTKSMLPCLLRRTRPTKTRGRKGPSVGRQSKPSSPLRESKPRAEVVVAGSEVTR